jgi:predicted TIM-barrel fold metal-dependent hydrolase
MTAIAPATSNNGVFFDPRADWLALHTEDTIDPGRPIVDAHHHLWEREGNRYMIEDITADIDSGHNVIATVYVDCRSMYRTEGPEPLRPVGEVAFAADVATQSAAAHGKTQICAGIVGHANLTLGTKVRSVLEAEIDAGRGRFRGIRHQSAWDADENVGGMYAARPKGLLRDAAFREGFACLAPLGLTFDAWLFHPQIAELTDLAKIFPETTIVLDHCGGPLGVGRFAGQRDSTFRDWRSSISELARCPNVVVKLGGLGMRLLGEDFQLRPTPPTSEDVAAAWRPYIETCIEAFGADRAMFESNFPPDKGQASYQIIFNAFKRIAMQYNDDEQTALFSRTATNIYRL